MAIDLQAFSEQLFELLLVAKRDKWKEYSKSYRHDNPAETRKRNRSYYEANREKCIDLNRLNREKNRESGREYARAYYAANRDNRRNYYEANRDKRLQYAREYRARKKAERLAAQAVSA